MDRPLEHVVCVMDHDVARSVTARAEMTATAMRHLRENGMTMKESGEHPDLIVVAVCPGDGGSAAKLIQAAFESAAP